MDVDGGHGRETGSRGDGVAVSVDQAQPRGGRLRIWRLVAACGLGLLLPLVGIWIGISGAFDGAAQLREAGWWLMPVYTVAGGILVGLALMPSHLTSLFAGLLFGLVGGLPVAVGIVLIGTVIGYAIGRRLTGGDLRALVDRFRWGRRLAAEMIDAPTGKAILVVALARLPPQMPFAMGNVLAASSGIRLVPLVVGTALGMAPRIGLVVWIGAELSTWKWGMPIPARLTWAVASAVFGFGGLGIWSWRLLRKPVIDPEIADRSAG